MPALRRPFAPAIVLAVLAFAPVTSRAQGMNQDAPKNLQVLPKDTPRRQVIGMMRAFNAALGVRCTHCHDEGANGENDFPSDAKDAKKIARSMMQMSMGLNNDWLAKLPASTSGPRGPVNCYTCHQGTIVPPRALSAILVETTEQGGAPAAVAKYKELRDKELETGRYDFRADSFQVAALRLADGGKTAEALALAQQGRALFPTSAAYQAFVGQLCAQNKDVACAEAALKKALELDPNNAAAKRALGGLKR